MIEINTLLGLCIALVGPPAVAIGSERLSARVGDLAAGLIAQVMLVALLGVVLVEHLAVAGRSLVAIGLQPPTLATLVIAVATTAAFVGVIGPLLLRLPGSLGLTGFETGLGALARLPIWYLVLAIVVGATVEEVLYRGYALGRVAELLGSQVLALVLVSATFGAAHAPLWGWGAALATALAGAVFSVLYLWHGDLAANIAAHIATDLAGIVAVPLRQRLARMRLRR